MQAKTTKNVTLKKKLSTKKKEKPVREPRPPGEWVKTAESEALAASPADYTFKKLKKLVPLEPETARMNRLGLLTKGPNLRLVSRSLWLNHNRLTSLQNLHGLVNEAIENPNALGFLDISCNELTEIHSDLFRYPNITVLYLHGNKLNKPEDIFSLRKLKKLQHLTIFANPWCERTDLGSMRKVVAAYLPKLAKLDHNRYTQLERDAPLQPNALKILRQLEGMPPDWLFKKYPIPKLTPEIEEYCIAKAAARTDVTRED